MSSRALSSLSEDLERWLSHLRDADRAPTTIRDYADDVRCFLSWIQQSGGGLSSFYNITPEDARQFRSFLTSTRSTATDRPLSPATINRRIRTVSSFLNFLGVPKAKNAFRAIKRISEERGAPKSISRNQWNAVRRAAAEYSKKDGGLSLAVVSLLRHAGLRAGELASLSADDVSLTAKAGHVSVRQGKGMKARVVPLVSEAREGISEWLETRAKALERLHIKYESLGKKVPSWANLRTGSFIFGQRGPFSVRGLEMITDKIGERAGLPFSLGPHRLRHTFAKAAVDPAGYGLSRAPLPLAALQKLLGHVNIQTTAIYTEFSDADLVRLLEDGDNTDPKIS